MSVKWTLTLGCSDCGASVAFENEPLEIIDDIGLRREIEEAYNWLRNHETESPFESSRSPFFLAPRHVEWSKEHKRWFLVKNVNHRFVPCPACGNRMYLGGRR